jgi:hypothetical protein
MDRDPLQRRADMLPHEAALPRQHLKPAIEIDIAIGHLAPPFGGDHEHRPDAAVDVDPVVGHGRAGAVGQAVERLAPLVQIGRQRLEHPRAVVEPHGTQRGAALGDREVPDAREIEAAVPRLGENLSGGGVGDGARVRAGHHPTARNEALHRCSVIGPSRVVGRR